MVGQCYDGVATLAGCKAGIATGIREIYPKALSTMKRIILVVLQLKS